MGQACLTSYARLDKNLKTMACLYTTDILELNLVSLEAYATDWQAFRITLPLSCHDTLMFRDRLLVKDAWTSHEQQVNSIQLSVFYSKGILICTLVWGAYLLSKCKSVILVWGERTTRNTNQSKAHSSNRHPRDIYPSPRAIGLHRPRKSGREEVLGNSRTILFFCKMAEALTLS